MFLHFEFVAYHYIASTTEMYIFKVHGLNLHFQFQFQLQGFVLHVCKSEINQSSSTTAFYTYKYLQWLGSHLDWLVQERRNSSALAMELRLSFSH